MPELNHKPNRRRRTLRTWARSHRRGVVSVVAMMFLVLFGSLAAAMAIMSKGNIVNAATHQHVSRAQGAAETGLAIAEQRLREAAARFVVEKGNVDSGFGERLWTGSFSGADGEVTITPPYTYTLVGSSPDGMADAIAEIHTQDTNTILVNGISVPSIGPAPTGFDPTVFRSDYWVRTPAIALNQRSSTAYSDTAFQVTYAPMASGNEIRVIVTGYDFGYTTGNEPISRTIRQDFKIVKRVDAAVLSPSRIMIGKNVSIEGDLGALYADVDEQYGDPLVMKSDFFGIDGDLDDHLESLFDALVASDMDRDNRLRVGHPIEGPAIPDFSALGYTAANADVTNDGFVDEFDVFIMFYDANHDGRVVLCSDITVGTPAESQSPEFEADDDLGLLIDSVRPDRNRNGMSSFVDTNNNNRFDPGVDQLLDQEPVVPAMLPGHLQSYVQYINGNPIVYADQILGFRDGVVDRRDQYQKVQGRLVFRVTDSEWTAGQGNYRPRLNGAVAAGKYIAPVTFGATEAHMPDLTSESFTNSQTALRSLANGSAFDQQVAANLGCAVGDLPTWTLAQNPPGATAPKFNPIWADANDDGRPDNYTTAHFEKSPYNSPTYFDYYYRPVYENMVFRNVQIPIGTNGLFKNCTFIGVTWVRTYIDNTHANWAIYGKMKMGGDGKPTWDPPRTVYPGPYYPAMLDQADRPVLMATAPMDKADIPTDRILEIANFDDLAYPLIINGRRVIDTKKWSNSIRFHNCLFVGGIVSDVPTLFTHARNKLEYTGSTRFVSKHPQYPEDPAYNPSAAAEVELRKSTMMLPNYSVDIGSFNSPPDQDVRLKGAIVAGVLDIRGNASIDGSLLLTFKPVMGVAPLVDPQGNPVGNPALFNATIGYFGQEDGDDESLRPDQLPIENGVRIVGWDLDGDGLPDLGPTTPPTQAQLQAGATPVPFHGYGRVHLRFDPNMSLPDGIMLPLQVQSDRSTYRETAQ